MSYDSSSESANVENLAQKSNFANNVLKKFREGCSYTCIDNTKNSIFNLGFFKKIHKTIKKIIFNYCKMKI